MESFSDTLTRHGLTLVRDTARTLQINAGLLCNQACRHCHLEAGPDRTECMGRETVLEVAAYARRCRFDTVDVTGGAPELVPEIGFLIESLAPFAPRLLFRCNLTALAEDGRRDLVRLWKAHRVSVVASLPSSSPAQTDAQRGAGTWERSVEALAFLNEQGYGRPGTGLELDLVSNPAGAFLPPPQQEAEERFRRDLARRAGVEFGRLYTFANAPLGRFRTWLERSGNLEAYGAALRERFNPCTVDGLMCRTLVSVSWDGCLYDCDFNQAAAIPLGGRRTHVSECAAPPAPGTPIGCGDHCFSCTAGSGFT